MIPCYGQAQYLGVAVKSALDQSLPAVQIIVVNDGSPDTRELEEVLAPFADWVTYIRQENRGLSGARNRGLEVCTGDHVVFLDADDLLLPDALDAGERALADDQRRGLVWGARRTVDRIGVPIRLHSHLIARPSSYAELLRTNIIGPPVGVMFRRDVVAALGGFATDMRFAEDYELYLRIARDWEIYRHGVLVADYRVHDRNMSSNYRSMRRYVLKALDRQSAVIGGDPGLNAARECGVADAWESYDWQGRLGELYRRSARGHWIHAAYCALQLLARYPTRFTPILAARMKRSLPKLDN